MGRRALGVRLEANEEGIFYIRFPYGGHGVSTRTRDPVEAANSMATFLTDRAAWEQKQQSPLELVDALDYYMGEYAETGNVVSLEHPRIICRWLKAHFGRMAVRDIRQPDIARYITKRRGEGVGDGTINRELRFLITAVNYNVANRRLSKDELIKFELPKPPKARDRWLLKSEAHKLLEATRYACGFDERSKFTWQPCAEDTRAYTFMMLALLTGARCTAIEELTWDRVYLDHDKESGLIQLALPDKPETTKRRPVVPIHRELYHHLVAIAPAAKNEYVLGSRAKIRWSFATACERVGLDDVTPHTLRHTFATWLAQAGVSMWEIAGLLGDSVQTVQARYLHHSPEHLRSAIHRINVWVPLETAILEMKI